MSFEFRSGDLFQTRLAQKLRQETRENSNVPKPGTSRERWPVFLIRKPPFRPRVGTVQPAWRLYAFAFESESIRFWGLVTLSRPLRWSQQGSIFVEGLITIYDEIVGGHKPARGRALPSFFDHLAWAAKAGLASTKPCHDNSDHPKDAP